ncbi:hypothetical protein G8A07_00740 [Roseateles sp. DAIF2]|uniref:hypothetical protein n=1 Tax=Roseateles sp. DAIF2 TaxID=2714952 RepID=UPI0018A30FC5|nr:hypothetical protein [Roseateles sp. DAIF2]QPF71593.1 hypothetical protein G8A07_00740 [Roseateles sp. DAIF2]
MQQLFAFLYRPTRPLDEADRARRSLLVREWSLAQHAAGRALAIAVFDEATLLLRHDDRDDQAPDQAPAAGCTLFQLPDLDAALALARDFPGRAFGTDVEIRPVKTFVPPTT